MMNFNYKDQNIKVKSQYNFNYVLMNQDNFDTVYTIQKNTWKDDDDYAGLYDKCIHTSPINCMFLIYDGACMIGIVGIDFYEKYPNNIWLDWFTILPEYRRCGYGEKVLLDMISYCRDLGNYDYFRIETTYYEGRPAVFLYDKIMQLREDYTIEDTKLKVHHTLIYSYSLHGKKMEAWDNRYLGLEEYYNHSKKRTTTHSSF